MIGHRVKHSVYCYFLSLIWSYLACWEHHKPVLEGVVGCPRDGERNAEWLKEEQVSDLKPCDSTCLYNFSEEPFPINHILCRNTQISNINSKQ